MKRPAHQRQTVAVLVDYMNLFAGGYEAEFRRLFEGSAQVHELNLLFTYGRAVQHPDPGFAAHNRIYELLSSRSVQAVIALSSSITSFCGLSGATTFFERYSALARCSIGLAIPSVPSIEVDNEAGMTALLEHLVVVHGYRRIAFIRGPIDNIEASTRFGAYRDALARHGIEFDESLVSLGDFSRRSGNAAVDCLLRRKERPEVIVAANDGMALGAISQLRSKGIQVPSEIAVTGFDNLVMAKLGHPPLTTVAQPKQAMVELAMQLIERQLAGEQVPLVSPLTAEFLVRASCGCNDLSLGAGPAVIGSIENATPDKIVKMAAEQAAVTSDDDPQGRILRSIIDEFNGRTGAVRSELYDILEHVEQNETFQSLQLLLLRLRSQFASIATPELDALWHRACAQVALINTSQQEQLRLDHDQAYYHWIDVGERFGAALDIETLARTLAGALVSIGIGHAYISFYPDSDQRELECFVALRDGAEIVLGHPRFPADALVPPGAFGGVGRTTFLAFPLAFHAKNLGVAVFELSHAVGGYPIVRDQISAVLQSISLHQEILKQTTLHERRIQEQERAATAARIQSLSVLAGGVAHDLNNVLGPLVALPDLMMEQLHRLGSTQNELEEELRSDLETIKVAASRATQTIKDLLTLGRQGHTPKETLDLNCVVSRCVGSEPQRRGIATPCVELALATTPLFVMGSESHISRVVLNLVRNAMEAIGEQGVVKVRTAEASLNMPMSGHEVVPPGHYALIAVSDTGRGIPVADLNRLFEPFFSKKRLSEHSGSGLGLAIVHGVVKEHRGYINVESVADQGTTFTLYFPLTEAVCLSTSSISEVPHGNGRILVVDDEIIQLRTCRRVLRHLGYQVDTQSSGRAALEQLSRSDSSGEHGTEPQRYDLVILDMLLNEDEDGLVLFERIRAIFPEQRAIIASGHAPGHIVDRAKQQGAIWLPKPYTRSSLARTVQIALGRGRV